MHEPPRRGSPFQGGTNRRPLRDHLHCNAIAASGIGVVPATVPGSRLQTSALSHDDPDALAKRSSRSLIATTSAAFSVLRCVSSVRMRQRTAASRTSLTSFRPYWDPSAHVRLQKLPPRAGLPAREPLPDLCQEVARQRARVPRREIEQIAPPLEPHAPVALHRLGPVLLVWLAWPEADVAGRAAARGRGAPAGAAVLLALAVAAAGARLPPLLLLFLLLVGAP